MNEQELKQFLKEKYPKENEACEWKEFGSLKNSFSGSAGDDIISYVSAIANMEGGALVIGVEDNTCEIKGIRDFNNHTTQKIKLRILEKCANLSSEGLHAEDFTTSDSNKTIWIIHIPKHLPRQPVIAHSKAWQRIEDSLVELRKERRDAILKEPAGYAEDWSAAIIPEATIDDLDPLAIIKAREEYKTKNPNRAAECDQWDDITFLNKAKVTIKGAITNTAILLLGNEESSHFLQPAIAKISWILKDDNNAELDYEHFGTPFILSTEKVRDRIRNLTYRYLPDSTLFPTEIPQYDSYVIREALHNCIAHQDYSMRSRITVVEKTDELVFTNVGHFIPESVEIVIEQDAPQEFYRNAFLAEAMVNLNMIDTIGSGIKRMFNTQRKRFFPMPDYDLSNPEKVAVRVLGRVWDINYTRLLIKNTDLDLKTVVLLDRVQKHLHITDTEASDLRKQRLIEGRKNNLYVSFHVAKVTGDKASYIKNKGFDDQYYKDMILEYIRKFHAAVRADIEALIIGKLPAGLTEKQKKDKVKNLLQDMKRKDLLTLNEEQKWILKK